MQPTASLPKSPWSLRFLSGPLYGRSMPLKRGQNWVGSSADCDVILPDRAVAGRHLCLEVGDIAVAVRNVADTPAGAEATPVQLGGTPLPQGVRRTLSPSDAVDLGPIRFGVERIGGPATAVQEPPAPVRERGVRWLIDMAGVGRFLRGRGSRAAPALVALWCVLAMITLLAAVLAIRGEFRFRSGSTTERIAQIQQALGNPREIVVAPMSDGTYQASGYVETQADRKTIGERAARIPKLTLGEIYVVGDLLATAQQFVSDGHLKVEYAGHGRVIVSGETNDYRVRDHLRVFARDARPAIEVVDNVQYKDGGPVEVGQNVDIAKSSIVGVYADEDGMRFVTTRDGQHYFEGSRMPDGDVIRQISTTGVTFDHGGTAFVRPIQGGGVDLQAASTPVASEVAASAVSAASAPGVAATSAPVAAATP